VAVAVILKRPLGQATQKIGVKKIFALPRRRHQARLRESFIGASRTTPRCASFVLLAANRRLNINFQKVLAKSKVHH
jgi:hypothetical protein